MKTAGVLAATALWMVTLACSKDPARSVKIAPSPSQPVPVVDVPPPAPVTNAASPPSARASLADTSSRGQVTNAARPPQPAGATIAPDTSPVAEFCPPPAEDLTGPSNLTIGGPCGFQHQQAIKCESSPDDFIIGFVRKALHGATVAVYINVENYHGPGSYDGTQMFIAVQSGTAIFRWSNDNVHAEVGPGEAFLELPMARLEAEPMLIDCSRLIGPESNYQYQCGGRTAGSVTAAAAAEIVSGRLVCAQTK